MTLDTSRPVLESLVVIMAYFDTRMNLLRSSTFSWREALVSLFATVKGSAGLSPVEVFEKPRSEDIVTS